MSTEEKLKTLLEKALHLQGRTAGWNQNTPLLGGLPELDSLAVVGVIAAIETQFGFRIEDDEINAEMMATLASLTQFVQRKLDDSR